MLRWALDRFVDIGGTDQQGWAHLGWRTCRSEHDTDRDAALRSYHRALEQLRRAGDRRGEANALGCIAQMQATPARAVSYLQAAISTFSAIGDIGNRAVAEYMLARACIRTGRMRHAEALISRSEQTLTGIRHEAGIAQVRIVRAELLLAQGAAPEAVQVLESAVGAFRGLGVPTGVAYALYQLARAQVLAGDPRAARRSGQESVELYHQQGDAFGATVRDWLRTLP